MDAAMELISCPIAFRFASRVAKSATGARAAAGAVRRSREAVDLPSAAGSRACIECRSQLIKRVTGCTLSHDSSALKLERIAEAESS